MRDSINCFFFFRLMWNKRGILNIMDSRSALFCFEANCCNLAPNFMEILENLQFYGQPFIQVSEFPTFIGLGKNQVEYEYLTEVILEGLSQGCYVTRHYVFWIERVKEIILIFILKNCHAMMRDRRCLFDLHWLIVHCSDVLSSARFSCETSRGN